MNTTTITDCQITIEKDLPIPEHRFNFSGLRGLSDVMRRMEVGDSVLLPYHNNKKPRQNIASTAKKIGIRVTIRRVSETEVRFWRVA